MPQERQVVMVELVEMAAVMEVIARLGVVMQVVLVETGVQVQLEPQVV